jgi:hypothetical protein
MVRDKELGGHLWINATLNGILSISITSSHQNVFQKWHHPCDDRNEVPIPITTKPISILLLHCLQCFIIGVVPPMVGAHIIEK